MAGPFTTGRVTNMYMKTYIHIYMVLDWEMYSTHRTIFIETLYYTTA